MFKPKFDNSSLDAAIEELIRDLRTREHDSDEYQTILDQLDKLSTIRNSRQADGVSKDALVTTIGSIVGILVIVGYEHAHIVTSKALPFIKLR